METAYTLKIIYKVFLEVQRMNKRELIEYLDTTGDFNFGYKDIWYFISGLSDGSFSCGIEDSMDDEIFESIDDVLNHFIIDSKPLKDILPDIEW